ncbi:unnamed protein product [Thlaspi arvense]|uniref:RING-type E3 ubiquitin transferase n=1 Tax=Thlaspi arvense TaxID=13288 RepID=A0AAU9RGE0_THLAR|nr:unnamed protein product [Thlaspi arvense]
MKFCKTYEQYMQGQDQKKLPGVGFKKLKKILKKCRTGIHPHGNGVPCPSQCPVRAKRSYGRSVMEPSSHPFSKKCLQWLAASTSEHRNCLNYTLLQVSGSIFCGSKKSKQRSHVALIQEGRDLVTYAIINAIAMRKILKKYDKETVFDPVALTCGHIFCYLCACKAASVTIVDGLKATEPKEKCPLCREAGVYEAAVHLEELSILLSGSCPEYWEERLQAERIERVKQTKEHWDLQCRAFMGM